jgi:hypothetical protein
MSYNDRTYCDYYDKCRKGDKCNRACTEEIKKGARYSKQLLSLFYEKPACFRKKTSSK